MELPPTSMYSPNLLDLNYSERLAIAESDVSAIIVDIPAITVGVSPKQTPCQNRKKSASHLIPDFATVKFFSSFGATLLSCIICASNQPIAFFFVFVFFVGINRIKGRTLKHKRFTYICGKSQDMSLSTQGIKGTTLGLCKRASKQG